ncbi:MAG: hypothetical protein JRJ85_11130 [Deltaproteobacteria bacterium]|nr:hypothetical protein [Deltaproteobacteria bacterium]
MVSKSIRVASGVSQLDRLLGGLYIGDVIYLTSEMPSQWKNPGPGVARLLWIKVK